MGRFYTVSQLYCPEGIERFCEYMKKAGYVTCEADYSQKDYTLLTSENCPWITVWSESYGSGEGNAVEDTEWLAKIMNTHSVNIICADSDFVVMQLFGSDGNIADTIFLGRPEPEDSLKEPDWSLWEQFFAEGVSREQFSEKLRADTVFVEEALSDLAPLIRMDREAVLFDPEFDKDKENITRLYFRRADAPVKKKITVNSAFVKVYGDGLAPHGFIRLKKTKRPVFARLVHGDILHLITYQKMSSGVRGHKSILPVGGVFSLYRRKLGIDEDFFMNAHGLLDTDLQYFCDDYSEERGKSYEPIEYFMLSVIGHYAAKWGHTAESYMKFQRSFEHAFRRCIVDYRINAEDSELTVKDMETAFSVCERIMIPALDRLVTPEACIRYLKKRFRCYLADLDEYLTNDSFNSSEGLFSIVYNDRELNSPKSDEARDKILNTPELLERALAEAEKVKNMNLEILRSHGLEVSE